MKKLSTYALMALCSLSALFTSCEENEGQSGKISLSVTPASFETVEFATNITITGTVTNADKLEFISVKSEKGTYTLLGDAQRCGIANNSFTMNYFVDDNEMTHIKVIASNATKTEEFYIPVLTVVGEPRGGAILSGEFVMMTDSIVQNPTNTPTISVPAGSETPSFYSLLGADINGTKKHVLNLNEVRAIEGRNVSFCFLNCLYNTANAFNATGDYRTYIGSQRGFMFSNLLPSQLGGGTTGRQCDLAPDANGKKIEQVYIDTTVFRRVSGSWDANWTPALYQLVDSVFMAIGDNASSVGKQAQAYELIELIRKRFDSATLDPLPDNPVSLPTSNFLRKRTDAGHTATNAMVENFRAGDYVILKTRSNGKLYYGIMQIVSIPDDTQYMMDEADIAREGKGDNTRIDKYKAHNLFLKPAIFNIKMQADIE